MNIKSIITSAICLFVITMTYINSNAQQRTFIEGTEPQALSNHSIPPVEPSAAKLTRSHNRSYDGTNNNIGTAAKQLWGSVNIPLFRELAPVYGPSDPKNAMGGVGRPSPREISNLVVDEPVNTFNALKHTAFVYV